MKLTQTENFQFDHVKLMDTGTALPVVFSIDEGYKRGECLKTQEGGYVALLGVSNVKADRVTISYNLREKEEVTPLLGVVINSRKEAEVLSEFFKNVAEKIP